MKNLIITLFLLISPGLTHVIHSQVKIIFDTDFGGDADDLGALAMLHHFTNNKECGLLAVMSWTTEMYTIAAIDAVNHFYGFPGIPIGIRSRHVDYREWNYNKVIADQFPHTENYTSVPLAKDLYRQILSGEEDNSVVVVTVGPLKNILDLLESEPDAFSDLTGNELFHKKVKEVVIMGGKFPEGKGEWNFDGAMPGITKKVLDKIKAPVVFSGFETGVRIKTGEIFNQIDPATPLYIGFYHFSKYAPWMREYYHGRILDNSTYDQTAVLYAVRGGVGNYWDLIEGGHCYVEENGDNRWIPGEKTNQSYLKLIKDPDEMADLIEAIMLGEIPEK